MWSNKLNLCFKIWKSLTRKQQVYYHNVALKKWINSQVRAYIRMQTEYEQKNENIKCVASGTVWFGHILWTYIKSFLFFDDRVLYKCLSIINSTPTEERSLSPIEIYKRNTFVKSGTMIEDLFCFITEGM